MEKEKICMFCEIDWDKLNEYLLARDGFRKFDLEHPDLKILKEASVEEFVCHLGNLFGKEAGYIIDNFVKQGKHRRYLKKVLSKIFYNEEDEEND